VPKSGGYVNKHKDPTEKTGESSEDSAEKPAVPLKKVRDKGGI